MQKIRNIYFNMKPFFFLLFFSFSIFVFADYSQSFYFTFNQSEMHWQNTGIPVPTSATSVTGTNFNETGTLGVGTSDSDCVPVYGNTISYWPGQGTNQAYFFVRSYFFYLNQDVTLTWSVSGPGDPPEIPDPDNPNPDDPDPDNPDDPSDGDGYALESSLLQLISDFNTFGNNTSASLTTVVNRLTGNKDNTDTIKNDTSLSKTYLKSIWDYYSFFQNDLVDFFSNSVDNHRYLREISTYLNNVQSNNPPSNSVISTISPQSSHLDSIRRKLFPNYSFFTLSGSASQTTTFHFDFSDFPSPIPLNLSFEFQFPFQGGNSYVSQSVVTALNGFISLFRSVLLALLAWCFLKVIIKTLRQW